METIEQAPTTQQDQETTQQAAPKLQTCGKCPQHVDDHNETNTVFKFGPDSKVVHRSSGPAIRYCCYDKEHEYLIGSFLVGDQGKCADLPCRFGFTAS